MLGHHWAVFRHFSTTWYPFDQVGREIPRPLHARGSSSAVLSQVVAYFVLCVWLVPFTLFISLSANENTLPTTSRQANSRTGPACPACEALTLQSACARNNQPANGDSKRTGTNHGPR